MARRSPEYSTYGFAVVAAVDAVPAAAATRRGILRCGSRAPCPVILHRHTYRPVHAGPPVQRCGLPPRGPRRGPVAKGTGQELARIDARVAGEVGHGLCSDVVGGDTGVVGQADDPEPGAGETGGSGEALLVAVVEDGGATRARIGVKAAPYMNGARSLGLPSVTPSPSTNTASSSSSPTAGRATRRSSSGSTSSTPATVTTTAWSPRPLSPICWTSPIPRGWADSVRPSASRSRPSRISPSSTTARSRS